MSLDRLSTALSRSYRLERELGQGGMAPTSLAEDRNHGGTVTSEARDPEDALGKGVVLGLEIALD